MEENVRQTALRTVIEENSRLRSRNEDAAARSFILGRATLEEYLSAKKRPK